MKGILWGVIQQPLPIEKLYSCGLSHHCTLQFGVERKDWQQYEGREFKAIAIAHCYNDRIQAIAIALPGWVPCQNQYPHITVSYQAGVEPVESNAMLEGMHHREEVEYSIQFKIEFLEW